MLATKEVSLSPEIYYLHSGTMSLPSHLHHTTTRVIYSLFCNNLNFSSRAAYAIWTMVPGILSGTVCLNIWQVRPCVHPGGKPLCSPHQHCKYTLPNNHIQQHFRLPLLELQQASTHPSRFLQTT